ncbi:hypothetical protein OF122_04880 [Pelagibacterium flavum]|uniref:Uncharacterized protein n=1 Tax=Pelagibacterium flavum TaxID=2984530 RepID=A0ABY6ITR8_9HYPH|nr:hypothetical protein [Pelagibacterium sp. YIM 151497]UYQ73100.1 hypothetical protein OF122_04880 [Pelagibacterium sp. YIM 151497]
MSGNSAQKLRRRIFNVSTGKLAIGVLLIWGIISGQGLAGYLTKDSRLSPGLLGQDAVDVVVVLDFAPERFHNEQIARYGVFSGRDGDVTRFRLRNVSPGQLEALSSLVWISRIEPLT